MRRKFILFTLLIAVCSLAVWAGVNPQKGKGKDKDKAKADAGKVAGKVADSTKVAGKVADSGKVANAGKVKEARVVSTNPSGCPGPRPPNRGCKIACKPCFIPTCEDGKWKYEKVEWSKEECSPRPLPGGGGQICPRDEYGQCPAECKKCVGK
jgi:hypothetical protein